MTLDELYRIYGELGIQAEIIQGKLMEVKKQIADRLNSQVKPVVDDKVQ